MKASYSWEVVLFVKNVGPEENGHGSRFKKSLIENCDRLELDSRRCDRLIWLRSEDRSAFEGMEIFVYWFGWWIVNISVWWCLNCTIERFEPDFERISSPWNAWQRNLCCSLLTCFDLQPISEKHKSLCGISDAISEKIPLREMKESIEILSWKGKREGKGDFISISSRAD